MADIDFDELDKAVNDLMANVDTSKRPAGLDDPEDTVLTVPTVESQSTPDIAPVAEIASEVSPSEGESLTVEPVEAAATPSLAVKRRGQFMDIVHPSLDMTSAAPKPVSRQGVTLQPNIDGVTASVAPVEPTPETTSPEPVVDQSKSPSTADSPWPDPIDMAATTSESTETADTSESTEVPTDPVADEAPADTEPLSSPFLPDAKPEKRPLGGLAQTGDAPAPPSDSVDTAPVTPTSAETTPPVNLPEEFSGDLMAVESRDLSSHPDAAKSEAPAAAPSAEAIVSTSQQDETPAVNVPNDTQPPAGGSIAQQYTEQPSSSDQTNGSIYDTSTYHQAIDGVKPAKKKASSLTWIIWIIVLLLVGATAGAAYFYFTR